MRLAGQLLAVSAVTLLLPWAGCQYAREVEAALRDGEEQTLEATARLLGAAIAPQAPILGSDPGRWTSGRGQGADIYLHRLASSPTLDGFADDWGPVLAQLEHINGLDLLAGRRGSFVHLFAFAPGSRPPASLQLHGRAAMLEFPLEAPGSVTPVVRGAPEELRARGYWQATSRGWQLEARIPLAMLDGRLGVRILDAGGQTRAASFETSPGWLTGPDTAWQAALDELAPPGMRSYLTDRAGFVLASHGTGPTADSGASPSGWLGALQRRMLGGGMDADPPPSGRHGQLRGRHLELASLGTPGARRYAASAGGSLVAAAAPVGDPPAAIVVVERDTAEILSLTRAPTRRLLAASLFASLGAAAVLLGFAALLSLRIRRLRNAAGAAIGSRGEVTGTLPGAGAGDELGDLARSIGRLLGKVGEHNRYLQSLGGRLAHELRTPLAVVRSSLDNLEAERPDQGPWLGRARHGVDRMSSLVHALSAAQHIERAVAASEREVFDLAALAGEMVEAYRGLHAGRPFEFQRPAGPCPVHGSPDLAAQLLDKLVENAADFAPPGEPVRIAVGDAGALWRLSVANPGSRLPPGAPERLFDSLVSGRTAGGEPHLGLGLFIVRLIAEHHGGRAGARNLPEEGGVEFVVDIPKAGGMAETG